MNILEHSSAYKVLLKALMVICGGLALILSGPAAALQGKIYAPAEDTGNVAVFDAQTNQWMTNISVGNLSSTPHNPLVSPDGQSVWVTLKGSNEVVKIDVATDTVVGTYSTGGTSPIHMNFSPDGSALYIVNQASDAVTMMDTSTGSILDSYSFSASSTLHDIKVSPDGSQLWITDQATSSVNVINSNFSGLLTSIGVGSDPMQLIFSVDGSQVFTSNRLDGTVSVLDVLSMTNVDTYSLDPFAGNMGLVTEPDGAGLWLTGTSSSSLFNTSLLDGTTTTIPGLTAAHGLAISSDGNFVYTSVNQGGSTRNAIAVIDTTTETLVATIASPGASNLHGVAFVATVPVPAAIWLFGSGLIGLFGYSRRYKNNA